MLLLALVLLSLIAANVVLSGSLLATGMAHSLRPARRSSEDKDSARRIS
jgi:hypothetical protein